MMTITGLDQVVKLFDRLAQLPDQLATSAKEHQAQVRIGESTRGLYTQHRAGRRVAAVTLPAVGKTAWISVLDPQGGTSRGGDRTRFASREEALEHSRQHTLEVAGEQADKLMDRESDRLQTELDTLLGTL